MQLTRQSEYAIRIMLELAGRPPGEVVSSRTIAERQGVPEDFLKKTVQLLSLSGLVATQRGVQGGVRLCRAAGDISLADVVRAIEGPLHINVCLNPDFACPNRGSCPVSPVLARAQNAFLAELERDSLADLIEKANEKEDYHVL